MDGQAIFDRVATHLAKQGHQARSERDGCVYLAPNGDRCAAGCLISKRLYRKKMEKQRFGRNHVTVPWPPRLLPHKSLIQDLQAVHDEFENWCESGLLVSELASVAATFGLSSTILGTLDWSAVGSSQ